MKKSLFLIIILMNFNFLLESKNYLRAGQKAVDYFLETGDGKNCDFSGLDLRNTITLVIKKFGNSNRYTIWNPFSWFSKQQEKIDVSYSNLSQTNLSEIHITGFIMIETDLWQANLSKSHLSGVNLKQATLKEANLSDAKFSGVNLLGANLTGVQACQTRWSGVNASSAIFIQADLKEASFTGVNLSHTDFSEANISLANFSGANLSFSCMKYVIGFNLSRFSGVNTVGIIGL